MHLTPLEIVKQEFRRQIHGYRSEDVHLFLEMVAGDVEQLLDQRVVLERRVDELEAENAGYREIERSLRDALLIASEAGERGRLRAEEIVEAAENERRALIADAEAVRRDLLADIDGRREELAFEVETLERQYDHLVEKLRALVDEQRGFLDAAAAVDERPRQRPADGDARVVALAQLSPIASEGDEDVSVGAEAS